MKNRKYEHYNWFSFYVSKRLVFDLSFETCGYFDNRPRINIDILFFNLAIILPIRNKWTDECVPPKWGIAFHNATFWIYRGNKWWTFNAPWQWQWVRTSVLRRDGNWEHERKGDRKEFYKDHWKEILWFETYPYTYTLKNGEVQERTATVGVEEREWRMNWFKWLKLGAKIQRTISVEFNDEVGERTGSWKGGTTGCGYELLKNETPLESLRRMERNRKFK